MDGESVQNFLLWHFAKERVCSENGNKEQEMRRKTESLNKIYSCHAKLVSQTYASMLKYDNISLTSSFGFTYILEASQYWKESQYGNILETSCVVLCDINHTRRNRLRS